MANGNRGVDTSSEPGIIVGTKTFSHAKVSLYQYRGTYAYLPGVACLYLYLMTERYIRYFAILLMALLSGGSLLAQKFSNEFLTIGVGARAHGMGTAVTATQQDIFSAAWNPAGLAGLDADDGLQIGAMHAEWFGGVGNYDYLGFTLPLSNNNQRLGISLIRFGIDNIPNTLFLYEADGTINFDNITEFSTADYAFLGTYARSFLKPKGALRVGGNVKVIHRIVGEFATSWGFGLDVGAQLERNNWTFALLGKDITSTFNTWSTNFSEEEQANLELTGNTVNVESVEITNPSFILAVAHDLTITEKIGLTAELDLIATTDGERNTLVSFDPISVDPGLGVEADYDEFIFLRAGVSQLQRIQEFRDGRTNQLPPLPRPRPKDWPTQCRLRLYGSR